MNGQAADVPFRVSGKVITEPGWRAVFKQPDATAAAANGTATATTSESTEGTEGAESTANAEERTLPPFEKGESGPHVPDLVRKQTQPPKPYTEATLLRAMETAGRGVEDETLREALKENGIGRPSTRAQIIETLFKRNYIRRQRKALVATPTGIELIGLIREELLKSAELTGRWEKKLRDIEHGTYSAPQFVAELKAMVTDIVHTVMADNENRRITTVPATGVAALPPRLQQAATESQQTQAADAPAKPKRRIIRAGSTCPLCGQGKVIKGHTAYGCSRWKEGCTWRKPFK